MRRRVFDLIATAGGAVLVVALVVAGSLLLWGANFANSNVHEQLSQQKIYFPQLGSPALASPKIGPYLNMYAGQELLTAPQAKAYADHFIAVHLSEVAGGQTYSQVSGAAQTTTNTAAKAKLEAQAQTLFQGQTLRGLLLEAYAFGTVGMIAGIAAAVSYVLAAVMLILVLLGLWHASRTDSEAEVLVNERRDDKELQKA